MFGFKETALCVLLVTQAYTANTWNELIPQGKEVVYKYEALVKAGTDVPHPFSSTFKLFGKLHLQSGQSQDLLVRLSDLTYTLQNGREDEKIQTNNISITESLVSLTKSFRIVYDENGKFKELQVGKDEPVHVLNMKKAIAAILQVDWNKVKLDMLRNVAFKTKEAGVHGMEENLYNIVKGIHNIRIEKMHHMKTSEHLYHNILTNIKPVFCEAKFEEPISHDSQKVYIVEDEQGKHVLRSIKSTGGVYYHPFQAESSAFYVHITQAFNMLSIEDIAEQMKFSGESKHETLEHYLTETNTPFEIITDKSRLVEEAKNMLEAMVVFIRHGKIEMQIPDFENGQMVNRIRSILVHFDISMLESLNKLVLASEHPRLSLVFQQMLPFVGTKDSIKFIIKLIQGKTLKDSVVIQMMQVLPFHVRFPTVELIEELEVMLHFTDASKQVQKSAVLSFASLLNEMLRTRKHFHDNFIDGHHTDHHAEDTIDGLLDKYIKVFIDKLKEADNMDEQYLYLDALFNIKSSRLINPLINTVSTLNDENIKRKALWTISLVIGKDTHLLYETYWPILTDRSLPTEQRIIAYYTIMKSHPTLSLMVNIYWAMQSELDMELYQFHYTFMKSLAKSENPCYQESRLRAKQLMKYMGVPYKHGLTHFGRRDIIDKKLNSGLSLEWFLVNTDNALVLQATVGRTLNNLNLRPETYYIRISGLHGKVMDNFRLNINKQMKLFSLDNTLQKILKHLSETKGITLEIILMKHRQIVYNNLIDKDNISTEIQSLMNYQKNYADDRITIQFDTLTRIYLPTEIGFPLVFERTIPIISLTTLNNKLEWKDKVLSLRADNKFKTMIYTINGIAVHNPIAEVWQGVSKQTAYETQVPQFLDVSLNVPQVLVKMSWKRHNNPADDIMCQRNYAMQLVSVYDYNNNNILKKTTPGIAVGRQPYFVPAVHDMKFRNNWTITESEDYNTGYNMLVQIFDTESAKTFEESLPYMDSLTLPQLQQIIKHINMDDDFMTHLTRHIFWENKMYVMPRSGLKGSFVQLTPSDTNKLSSVDLLVRLDHEIVNDSPSMILPGMKILLKGTFAVKKEQKALKTWDANINWELDNGHMLNSIKAQITRIIPGQTDYKICVEGNEQYSDKGITGHMNVLMSQAVSGKCSKDETSIDVVMKGERLQAQIEGKDNFYSCHQKIFPDMPSYMCMVDHGSIRKYEVDIKSKNVPNEFKKWVVSIINAMKIKYSRNYKHIVEQTPMDEQNVKVMMRFPIENDVVDLKMVTKDNIVKFGALPAKDFRKFGFSPDNLYFSNVLRLMHSFDGMFTCSANTTDILNLKDVLVPNIISEEWELMLGDSLQTPERGLSVKRMDNKLAVKIVSKVHILLVLPVGDKFTATLDGVTLPEQYIVSNDWINLFFDGEVLVGLEKMTGVQIISNGRELYMAIPKLDNSFAGKCV